MGSPLAELLLRAVVVGLASWRLASLLVDEEGPGHVFARLRAAVGIPAGPGELPDSLLAGILSCVWCASVWVAPVFWLASYPWPELPGMGAAMAIALIAHRAVR